MSKEMLCPKCKHVWLWADWKKDEDAFCPEGYGCNSSQTDLRIEELEAENANLRKALDLYQRERDRYKHATPEMSGLYFLSGGHGPKDDNQMPQFVEVVPAYGCGWSMIYEDTGRKISYEGS